MSDQPTNPYAERISRVCEYIYQNLNEELTLDRLSDVAAFSKFHFHRVFSAYTGVSLNKFIQLTRLKRASFRLAFERDKRIIDIALEAGFESPEAFARAFKRSVNQLPSEFRAKPNWPHWHACFESIYQSYGEIAMEVKIIEFETTKVALIEHLGPPEKVYETASKFIAWRKATGLSPVKTSKTFGVPYSDPNNSDPEKFRWDICGSLDVEVPDEKVSDTGVPANEYGVKSGVIQGGRCAVARHKGSHDGLEKTVYSLYRDWLPQSGEEVRDSPCFFHYLNFVFEVDECDLLTDVYLPLR